MKWWRVDADCLDRLRGGHVKEAYFGLRKMGLLYQRHIQRCKGKSCSCGSGCGVRAVEGARNTRGGLWTVEAGDGSLIGWSGIWGGISGRALEARA